MVSAEWRYFHDGYETAASFVVPGEKDRFRFHRTGPFAVTLGWETSSIPEPEGELFAIERGDGREHSVCPFGNISGKEVWYEREQGPVDPSAGWIWFGVKNSSMALLFYSLSNGVRYCYLFRRNLVGPPERLDAVLNGDVIDVGEQRWHITLGAPRRISDPILGMEYTETPCSLTDETGEVLTGFREVLDPGEMVKANPVFKKFDEWALGDVAAAMLLKTYWMASQLADDLADEDLPKADRVSVMATVLRLLTVEIPANPFFRSNYVSLVPILASAIDYWELSNRWAHEGGISMKAYAYAHRESSLQVVRHVAAVVGGGEHARRVLMDAVSFFHSPGNVEPFEQWNP